MRSLDAAKIPLHLETIFQLAFRDALLQSRKSLFDLGHKVTADGLFFLLPSQRTTQDVSLLPARNLDLLDLHIRANLFEIIFPQLLLNLFQLAAYRAHQILSATLADGNQDLFTHHPPSEDPYPPGFPMP